MATFKTASATLPAIAVSAALGGVLLLPANAQDATSVDTSAAIASADWAGNMTITVDEAANTFTFQANGIPDHGFAVRYLIPTDPMDQPFAGKPAPFFNVVNSADYLTETWVETAITTRSA